MAKILSTDWDKIRVHFNKSFRTSLHVSIGSIGEGGVPNVTPIGTLFLNSNSSGFYFEKFPKTLPDHAKAFPNVCVLGVNSRKSFWLKALFKNQFKHPPAIKLYGRFGEKRKATEIEISRLNRRMKNTKGLRGNTYLWSDMQWVRDISFDRYEVTNLGRMTEDLTIKNY